MTQVCDQLYAHGVCHREDCPYSHDIHSCQPCRAVFETAQAYEQHIRTVNHRSKVLQAEKRAAGLVLPVACTVCSVDLSDANIYRQHARGRRHRKKMEEQGMTTDPGPEEIDIPRNCTRCDTCASNILTRDFQKHLNSQRHQKAIQFSTLQGAVDESEKDKNGVDVSPEDINFGYVNEITRGHATYPITLVIQNTNVTAILLVEVRLSSQLASRTTASR
jgi:helicase MOV-10